MNVNFIYNMDCLDGMRKMEENGIRVNTIITSPPYNTARNSKNLERHEGRYDVYHEVHDNEQYISWTLSLFSKFDEVLKENGCILYNMSYGGENTTLMNLTVAEIIKHSKFTLADIIVWEKNSALPNNVSSNKLTRICEFVYVFCRKDEFLTFTTNKQLVSKSANGQSMYENIYNKIKAPNNDESCPYNKATYSTELVTKLMDIYVSPGSLILDPFMGSGTTAVACIKRGHSYIGFELSEQQCEWANKRIGEIVPENGSIRVRSKSSNMRRFVIG